jgi:hypothetical protein
LYGPDSRRLACILADKTGQVVQLDGIPGAHYDAVPARSLLFSGDGKHLCYSARRGQQWFAILDGKESPAGIAPPSDVMLSNDGQHLAYSAHTAENTWDTFLDGKSMTGQFRDISHFAMTSDGTHWAFVGSNPQPVHQRGVPGLCVVVDGKASEPCNIVSCPPTFSPDGKHVTFALRIINLRGAYDSIAMSDWQIDNSFLVLQKVLYDCGATHKAWLDVNPNWNGLGPGSYAIFLDGKVLHQGWSDLAISPDGKHVASKSTSRVGDSQSSENWLDGKSTRQRFEAGPPLFSPDSAHVAFATQDEAGSAWEMVLDGQADAAPGLVFPTVDADERDGSWKPDADIRDQTTIENGRAYAGQYPYHFDSDGTLVYFRIADGHLYRVHWKPDDATTLPTTKP